MAAGVTLFSSLLMLHGVLICIFGKLPLLSSLLLAFLLLLASLLLLAVACVPAVSGVPSVAGVNKCCSSSYILLSVTIGTTFFSTFRS